MELPFHQKASPRIFENARFLKKVLTPSEKLLWSALRNRRLKGFKFRRQHPILCYIADFYCDSEKLKIEVHGEIHDSQDAQTYDQNRTKVLESYGLKVIRFTNNEVKNNLNGVLSEIERILSH